MTIHSWPWLLVAVGLTLFLLAVFVGWIYLMLDEDAKEFILGVLAIASGVAVFVGIVLLIGYGFSYSLTGHA